MLTLLLALVIPSPAYAALDGREIMLKHEEARKVPAFRAKAVLTSKKADGSTKEKAFTIWRKLKEDGVHFNSLTRFQSPAEVKDEAILFMENGQGENDILLYLPAYQKVRRIERTQQSSSFMGSDLSYSDITTPHVDDYHYTLKGEEACPGASGTCYKIEAKPASDSIRDRTGYARTVMWIRKDIFMPVKNENYDGADHLVKAVDLSEIDKLKSGKWFTKKIAVTSKVDGGTTIMHFSDVNPDAKIEPALFTQASLAKGAKD